jgi:glycosyltransferase involved in cell wall biosynthesis
MRRVIFLNRFFFPDYSATSQILSDLAFQLAEAGRQILVITSRQLYADASVHLPALEIVRGVTIHRIPTTRFGRSQLIGRGLDYASFYASLWRAVNRLATPGDILVAKTDPPMLGALAMYAARRRKAHLVNWLQDLYPEVAAELGVPFMDGRIGRMLVGLRNESLKSASMNVAIGERMAANLRSMGIPENRICVIPNWCADPTICPTSQSNNALRRAWGLAGKFVVGYSGNLGRAHEFGTLLEAARLLSDEPGIMFLVVGGGHFVEAFSRRVQELNLGRQFRFLPYQDQATLNISLGVPDLYWISLKPELEGLIVPSKFYSIAAAGRPMVVIGASNGELATLVKRHQCGYVVAPDDAITLAELLRRAAADPSNLVPMGQAARNMLDTHFSRHQACRRWDELFGKLMAADAQV